MPKSGSANSDFFFRLEKSGSANADFFSGWRPRKKPLLRVQIKRLIDAFSISLADEPNYFPELGF